MRTDLGLNYNLAYPEIGNVIKEEDLNHIQSEKSPAGEKPIVIVLLGWLECKDGQLEKYSDIYVKRGCIVLRCITPAHVIYFDINKLPALASLVVSILRENKLQDHPIFFHNFSNGGAYLYSYILREIAAEVNPHDFNIRGTIFDSGPLSPTAIRIYNALQVTSSSYKVFGTSLAPAIGAVYAVIIFLMLLRTGFNIVWECFFTGTFKRLSADPKEEPYRLCNFLTRIWKIKNHPFAFLYSEEDRITPFEEVEQIAAVIRKRGNRVKTVKFDGSDHVQHYRKYPKEYISAITEFIRSSMDSYNGPPILFDA